MGVGDENFTDRGGEEAGCQLVHVLDEMNVPGE